MKIYYGCDAHKRYSVFASMNERGQPGVSLKVDNDGVLFRRFLSTL